MVKLKYRDITDYKYEVVETYVHQTEITGCSCKMEHLTLLDDGILVVSPGWKWDGASGPTYDDPSNIRASLIHDALYCLMRCGMLKQSYREYADDLLRDVLIDDGMSELRANLWYASVRNFAGGCAKPGVEKTEIFEVGKA